MGGEEGVKVVDLRIADGAVQRAAARAGAKHVPEGEAILKKQALLLPHRLRNGRAKGIGEHAPEGIARVGVVIPGPQRFCARRGTENDKAAIHPRHGRETCDPFHGDIIAEIPTESKV